VSEGETGGSPMALPADVLIRDIEVGKRRQAVPWLAMIAAALLHSLALVALIMDWSHPARVLPEPDVIPVQVVFAPPAISAPAPIPAAPLAYRESGADQRTTSPPPAETPAPEEAAPRPPATEQAEPSQKPPQEQPAPTAEKSAPQDTAKPAPRKDVARLEPPKREAETQRAPRPAPLRRLNVQPGERFETGDPYLNQLHTLIERHRVYPRVMGPFGLPAEGTAVYDVALDRSGRIIAIKLEKSSGIAGIDQAVESMIRGSLPFPPLPTDYPDEIGIVVAIRVFPPS